MTRSWQSSPMGSHVLPRRVLGVHAGADALELAADIVEGGSVLVGADVGRIGIVERLEHAPDGALEQLARLRLADELIVDAPVGLDEGLDGRLLVGVAPERLAAQAEAGAEERGRRHRQQQRR